MDKKILFFDIDGTILSHRTHEVSESTKHAIHQAQANGHVLMINTGRANCFLDKTILGLGFDGFICGCGTQIIYKEEVLFHTQLSKDFMQALIQDLRDYKIEAILEGSKKIYYDYSSNSPVTKGLMEFMNKQQFNTGSWDEPDIIFDKLCIWPNANACETPFYEKYKNDLDFITREGGMYELVPKGYSKASGIEFMLKQLGISHENTYAFGDGENDLPMLTYAKHSIAMGNSPQSIKDIVTYVTEDVDQQGIEQALKHYSLI